MKTIHISLVDGDRHIEKAVNLGDKDVTKQAIDNLFKKLVKPCYEFYINKR